MRHITMSVGFIAGIPIGTFASGYIVAWLGLRTTILLMGVLYLAANPLTPGKSRPEGYGESSDPSLSLVD